MPTVIDELVRKSAAAALDLDYGSLPIKPRLPVAVLTCMDARLSTPRLLGVEPGDIHVLRNAGGVVTPDMIRSLVVSQRRLGTNEVMIIQHTKCGMALFTDEEFAAELETAAGRRPDWVAGTFRDTRQSVLASVARVRENPYLPYTDQVRGFVFDVELGTLTELT
ncbi:MAG: beta-class carbonic anhydrase [Frankiaceae bacterium]